MYFIQCWFICSPSDSTVSEDAGIEPSAVVTFTLAVRHSNHSGRSHALFQYFVNSYSNFLPVFSKPNIHGLADCFREEKL